MHASIHPCMHPSIHPYIHTYIHTYIHRHYRFFGIVEESSPDSVSTEEKGELSCWVRLSYCYRLFYWQLRPRALPLWLCSLQNFIIIIIIVIIIIIIIINPLTARVVRAPQMIFQPVFPICPCSPLPSGTCWTPGLSIPWCCLPTSSSVCLVFF